jgi:hypothetical protein
LIDTGYLVKMIHGRALHSILFNTNLRVNFKVGAEGCWGPGRGYKTQHKKGTYSLPKLNISVVTSVLPPSLFLQLVESLGGQKKIDGKHTLPNDFFFPLSFSCSSPFEAWVGGWVFPFSDREEVEQMLMSLEIFPIHQILFFYIGNFLRLPLPVNLLDCLHHLFEL